MKFTFKLNICQLMIFCLLLISTMGTLFYRTSGFAQLLMSFGLFVSLILPFLFLKEKDTFPGYFFWELLMLFFYLRKNPRIMNSSMNRNAMVFIVMVLFVWLVRYQSKDWVFKYFRYSSCVYLFYAVFTILEAFIPQLFYFTLQLFPNQADNLLEQYNQNCMPGLTNHYSTNGMLVVVGFLIYGAYMIYYWKEKHIYKILFVISLMGLLFTGKRAHICFGCAALFVAYYFFMSDRKRSRALQMIAILVCVVVMLIIICQYIPNMAMFIQRFQKTSEEGDVLLGRGKMWKIAIDYFKQNPILGIGWGRFITVNIHTWDAHNIYLQMLCEIGIVGTAVYVIYFIYFLWMSIYKCVLIRKNKDILDKEHLSLQFMVAIGIQVFFLLYGFTGNPLYEKEMYVPYFIACSISAMNPLQELRTH